MKKIYLLLVASLLMCTALNGQSLTYRIDLLDTYGDGWHNGYVVVMVNGTVVLDNITLPYGSGPASYYFNVNSGNEITTLFYPGYAWAYECYFYIYNETNELVITSGDPYGYPLNISYEVPGGNIFYNNDPGLCSAEVTYTVPLPNDTAFVVEKIDASGLTSGEDFPVGATLQQYQVDLGNGTLETVSFYVIVEDTEQPELTCQNFSVELNENDSAVVNLNDLLASYSDNCGIDTIYMDIDTIVTCTQVGENTVTITAEDIYGNIATCQAILTVIDNIPPKVTCPEDIVISSDPEECGAIVNYATDKIVFSEYFTQGQISPHAQAWNDFRAQLLSTYNYSKVTIKGDYDPVGVSVTDPNIVLQIANALREGSYYTVSVNGINWAVGDCGGIELYAGTSYSSVCSCTNGDYTIRAAYTGWEAWGGITTTSCGAPSQTMTVEFEIYGGNFNITDNCYEIVQTAGLPSGSLFPLGTTVNTFEITDLANNTTTCSFSVTVIDETPPVAACNNFALFLDNTGKAYITPEMIETNTSGLVDDACGIASITVDKTEFTCSDLGRNTVTLTVTDNNGNTSTCNPTVFVRDNFVPVISLVDDIEIEVPPGVCETSVEYPDIAVSYNCFVNLELIEGLGKNGMFPLGTTTETWQATNAAGQASTRSFTVTVNTTNALPTIDEIADVVAEKDSTSVLVNLTGISRGIDCQPQELTVTTETDNNELVTMLTVIYTSEDSTGTIEAEIAPETYGTANITVTVEDSEGGMVTETFALTVNPVNNAPFLVAPVADQTVNANRSLKIPLSSALGELFNDIDNEDLTISVVEEGTETLPVWATYQNDTLLCQPTIADTGCVNIVVTATDTSGATASDTFEICVDGYPVGTSDLAANRLGVKLYPNPTNGLVTVELSSGIHNTELSVMDIAGRIVLRKSYSASERLTFNMSGKVAGMYFVKMNIDGNQFIEKLIVKD